VDVDLLRICRPCFAVGGMRDQTREGRARLGQARVSQEIRQWREMRSETSSRKSTLSRLSNEFIAPLHPPQHLHRLKPDYAGHPSHEADGDIYEVQIGKPEQIAQRWHIDSHR